MNSKIVTVFVSLIVAGLVVGASLPIFATFTASSETVHNDGAGWVRFDLNTSADTTYNIGISWDENGYYLANGSNVQTYDDNATSDFETILYADSNVSVWTTDGDNTRMLGKADGAPVFWEFTEPITIVRDSEGVVISDGSDSYAFGVPEWAYIPWSGGSYGFFAYDEERGVTVPNGTPTAVVGGGFAGVYAYNDILRYDGLGLEMSALTGEDGLYYGAEWVKPAVPFDPEGITINPLDPSVINPGDDSTQPITPIDDDPDLIDPFDPDAEIMAVPTPTYTEGDWGYNLIYLNIDNIYKQWANIVSYSGSGGDIVVPATIGGYDVYSFGNGHDPNNSSSYQVFDNDALSDGSTLTLSEGIKIIGAGACSGVSKITGNIEIPKSVIGIGRYAFQKTGITNITFNNDGALESIYAYAFSYMGSLQGSIILPEGITTLGGFAFDRSYGLNDTLLIPKSITTYVNTPFTNTNFTNLIILSDYTPTNNDYNINTLTEVLDLADNTDFSVTRCGIPNNATVSDSIGDCLGFVGAVDYTSGNGSGSPTQQLIALLPVVMLAGIVLFSIVALAINRK